MKQKKYKILKRKTNYGYFFDFVVKKRFLLWWIYVRNENGEIRAFATDKEANEYVEIIQKIEQGF